MEIIQRGQISSDLPFKINKDTSRYIKFINTSGSNQNEIPHSDLLIGYNDETNTCFNGINHRLFIGGRGFDFRNFTIEQNGYAELELVGPEDPLYTLLDFEEPRVIYVVSRAGSEDLILQGCRIKSIIGNECRLSYSKYQAG